MRLLQITSIVISALMLFGCADDSGKKVQDNPNSCDEPCSGEPACLNDSTLKECKINAETGCAEWVESACPEDESCQNGACKTIGSCQTECTEETSCLNETTLGTCQINEETGCVEWIESACPEGESCKEGKCKSEPTECETACPKEGVCVDESTLRSCHFNTETDCAEWVESTCPEGTSCNEGMCSPPVCTDQCTAPQCADDHSYQKCEKNNDHGCMELSAPIACSEKEICKDGACVADDNIYLKSLQPIMQPFWDNKQMLEETAMFINVGDTVQMLYNVDNVEKLTSYDGSKLYTGGVDYTVVDGKLKTLTNAIPHITNANYYNVAPNPSGINLLTKYNGQEVYTYWGEGTMMTQWQVKVTYNHSDTWEGFKHPSYQATFAKFIQKLKNKENVKIMFYGDSITYGANASFVAGGGKQHTYAMLFTEALADLYGYKVEYQATNLPNTLTNMPETYNPSNTPTITYINSAVGGWSMKQGETNFKQYITPYANDCDLFILAFGMNDGGTDLTQLNQMAFNMLDRMHDISPNVSEIIISTMLPNPKATNGWYGQQVNQEGVFADGALKSIQAKGIPIALCQMTSMSSSILTRKEFKDYTGNNINHPNDFFSRIYAQTLLQTVIGYENMK